MTKKHLSFALFCIGTLLSSNDVFTAEPIEEKHSLKTNEDASQRVCSQQTSKETETPAPPPKKNKPHFAGARRSSEKPKEKSSSSKVKNQWVKTRTHPKTEKKELKQPEEKNTSPEKTPYLSHAAFTTSTHNVKTALSANSLLFNEDEENHSASNHTYKSEKEPPDCNYPLLGKDALKGHIFITGEWLFWRTRQAGLEFAVKGASPSVVAPFPDATSSKLKFGLCSGFRVGLGVHLPNDGWDIYVNYTGFHPKTSKSVDGSIFPLFLYNPPPIVASAHAKCKIDFKTLDIEIGRAYFIGKSLAFRPFIGMTGAWIDQRIDAHYEGGFIASEDRIMTHNDFKGAGPRLGVGSNWHLGYGFSLFGNFAASLLIGHFDLENEQVQEDLETIHLNNDLNLVLRQA